MVTLKRLMLVGGIVVSSLLLRNLDEYSKFAHPYLRKGNSAERTFRPGLSCGHRFLVLVCGKAKHIQLSCRGNLQKSLYGKVILMSRSNIRWILAFNASCGTCQAISERVAQACDGKLEMLPLTDSNVEQWREQTLGPQAPWVPTLLRITLQGTEVRAWTGPAMGTRLVHLLGLRSTMRVLASLEWLRRGEEEHLSKQIDRGVIGRAQFLRLCVGGAVAASLIMIGKMPVFATGENQSWVEAQSWVKANKGRLPENYDALIAYPMIYRKAIYGASTPKVRSQFWEEQLIRHRATHLGCSAEQEAVLDRLLHLTRTDLTSFTKADKKAAIDAFGKHEVSALIATLGPESMLTTAHPMEEPCNCEIGDDYCNFGNYCRHRNCHVGGRCGTWWIQRSCNGVCIGN